MSVAEAPDADPVVALDAELAASIDVASIEAEERAAAIRLSMIEAGRRKGGVLGAVAAGAMIGLRDIYEGPPKQDDIVIVSEAPGDPEDIDIDGITGTRRRHRLLGTPTPRPPRLTYTMCQAHRVRVVRSTAPWARTKPRSPASTAGSTVARCTSPIVSASRRRTSRGPTAGRATTRRSPRCWVSTDAAHGDTEVPTVDQIDVTYANLRDCDPALDIAIIEFEGRVVGYTRASFEDLDSGTRDCVVFAPVIPAHLTHEMWTAIVDGNEAHMERWAGDVDQARYRAYAHHPGPGLDPAGEAAWLEARGYVADEWGASLVRPHLDDIAERTLVRWCRAARRSAGAAASDLRRALGGLPWRVGLP